MDKTNSAVNANYIGLGRSIEAASRLLAIARDRKGTP